MAHTSLTNSKYAFSFAVINHTTGEIRVCSCDSHAIALRNAFARYDSMRRESLHNGVCDSIVLVDTKTDKEIMSTVN